MRDPSGKIWQEVKSTIVEYQPDIVGISANSPMFASACVVAKIIKEIQREIVVILGGPHVSMLGKEALNCQDIDIGIKGEGEYTVVELLDAFEHGKKLNNIQGIIYRENGKIVENSSRAFIQDLDSLCYPHENAPDVLKDYKKYPPKAFKNILATRGCSYNCFFCGSRELWSRKVRFRSPENVIQEIQNLQKRGIRSFRFEDDTFGMNKKYLNDLCNALILHCPGITWVCELHVNLVDEETISLMKKAGCYTIQLGIESGNNEILKKMRKNMTIEEAYEAAQIIKKYEIELEGFIMIGFPYETEETLDDTIEAIKKFKCDEIIYSIFTPYPGTEAFQFCKEKGLIGDDYDISIHNHQSPANCFCMNFYPERFRISASKIEKMIDRKNRLNRIRKLFSRNTLIRIQEWGTRKGFKKGIELFLGK